MPVELPYLSSYKNVGRLFECIRTAKQPEAFTHRFLADTLGLKSTQDRSLIPLLRALGFIDATGKPTPAYAVLKNPEQAPYAIGNAIRTAYEPLYASNETAHVLPPDQLKGLIAQVAGTDEGMTSKISGTLNALLKVAKFAAAGELPDEERGAGSRDRDSEREVPAQRDKPLRPEFHYNIQVHLPANATEDTYLHIFNALRKVFS